MDYNHHSTPTGAARLEFAAYRLNNLLYGNPAHPRLRVLLVDLLADLTHVAHAQDLNIHDLLNDASLLAADERAQAEAQMAVPEAQMAVPETRAAAGEARRPRTMAEAVAAQVVR